MSTTTRRSLVLLPYFVRLSCLQLAAAVKCCTYDPLNFQSLAAPRREASDWCFTCASSDCTLYAIRYKNYGSGGLVLSHIYDSWLRPGCLPYNFSIIQLTGTICFCNHADYCNFEFIHTRSNIEKTPLIEQQQCGLFRSQGIESYYTDDTQPYDWAKNHTSRVHASQNYYLGVLLACGMGVFGATFTCIFCFKQQTCILFHLFV